MTRLRLPILAALVAVAVGPGRLSAQTWSDKVTTTPVLIQDGFGPAGNNLAFGGQEYCVPTAVAMSLGYLGVNGFNQIGPANPTAGDGLNLIRVLGGLMNTSPTGGTFYDAMAPAVSTYFAAKGIGTANFTATQYFSPTLSQLDSLNQNQTVVDLCAGYYNVNTGARNGGHCVTLLSQGVNAQGQSSPNTVVINNPLPGAFAPLPDLAGNARQYLNTQSTSGALASAGALQLDPNQYPGFWGTTRLVIERAFAVTVNASQLSVNNPTIAPWTLASVQTINLQNGTLTVLAPVQGAGGVNKGDGGLLELRASNTTTGANTVVAGTLRSVVATGRPFGSGSLTLQSGTLQLVPAAGSADVSLSAADGAGNKLTYSAGASLALNRNGNTSLTFTLGGNTDGTTANLVRSGTGTLVIAPTGGTAGLGTSERLVVNGTGGNLPALTNGIVAPVVVARDSDAGGSGDFLTYGTVGFAKATYVQASSTPIASAGATAVYEANVAQSVADGTTTQVYALKVGPVTVGSGGGTTTLTVGTLAAGTQAGLILNGGTVGTTNLNFGAAEGVVYASTAGGTINAVVQGSGGLTKFGPGALTLTAANTYSGTTTVLSGRLVAANTSGASATGPGAITVAANGTLQISGSAARAGGGGVTVQKDGALLLSGGTVTGNLTMSAGSYLFGQGTVGSANTTTVVNGNIGGRATNPVGVTYTGVENITFAGPTTFNSPTVYNWRLNALDATPSNAGVNWSKLTFAGPQTGNNAGTSGSNPFYFTLDLGDGVPDASSGDPFWGQSHQWTAMSATNGFWNIWWWYSFPTYSQGYFSLSADAPAYTTLFVNYTPTPEPATWCAYALAAGLTVWRFRRRVG